MKILIFTAAIVVATGQSVAADVAVSVSIGEPGFYGQINIGNFPRPAVIYAKPVIIQPVAHYSDQPVYLRVPPGHAKKWSKHCHAYNACSQPVYFVKDSWYSNVYAPRYRAQHEDRRENQEQGGHDNNGKHQGKGHGKGHGKH